jgi:hypothetical protein
MKFACLLVLLLFCTRAGAAQNIYGSSDISFNATGSTGAADCETDLDAEADDGYYAARVTCVVTDPNGKTVATGAYSDDGDVYGYAEVSLAFSTTPGLTYTVTGGHSAALTVPADAPEGQSGSYYFDENNFEDYIESPDQEIADGYDWFGPGPDTVTRRYVITLPQTIAKGTAPQTPGALSATSSTAITYKTPYANGCPVYAPYGAAIAISYQVLDNTSNHNAIQNANMEPQEQTSNEVINGTLEGPGPAPTWHDIGPSTYPDGTAVPGTGKYTNSKGQFIDAPFAFCANSPFSLLTITQSIQILTPGSSGNLVRTNNWSVTSSSIGHGTINNGNDIKDTF